MREGNKMNLKIVTLGEANKLFKLYENNKRVGIISIVKNQDDIDALPNYLPFKGPKIQLYMRDLRYMHRFQNYGAHEVPSIKNLEPIFDFVDSLSVDLLIIHCRQGKSRSGACAVAILAYLLGEQDFRHSLALAQAFKVSSKSKFPIITPNKIMLSQFKRILKTRKYGGLNGKRITC